MVLVDTSVWIEFFKSKSQVNLDFLDLLILERHVATLRSHLSDYLAQVESGTVVEIQKRDVTIARMLPVRAPVENKTKLGCGKGSVKIKADLTQPSMDHWEMHED